MHEFLFLLLFLLLGTRLSSATQDQNYGLGGAATGRTSGVTAEIDNPYAALYNPALLAAQPGALFGFSTSATDAHFNPLKGVLVDSERFRTQNAVSRSENYQPPDARMTLWATGLSYPFNLPRALARRAGLGAVVSGPWSRLHSISSATPYDFSPFRYGTSDSQFKATFSTAVEVWPQHLYAGGGLSAFFTSSGAADATLFDSNPTGRLNLDVGLNTAAVAGVFVKAEDDQFSLVYREAVDPDFRQAFTGQLHFGGQNAFHEPFLIRASLYYEPQIVELEWQRDFGPLKASVGVSYQLWSAYKPSFLVVETEERGGPRSTEQPALALHNTLNPRASVQVPLFHKRVLVSGGYQFRPSPVGDLSGEANLLDSDTHIIGISIEHRLGTGEYLPFPVTWGVFGQYHWLTSRLVTKSARDFIGAPGYDFSGRAFVYGLSVQAEL